MFDYRTEAARAGITDTQLDLLRAIVRKDFPTDEMMFELHLLRICQAVSSGRVTVDSVINTESAKAA